jgi:hypothetical protein
MSKNIIALANDQTAFFPGYTGDVGAVRHGSIQAANDANFDAAHLSEPLTDYIVGYPDQDGLQALLDAAAPMIPSGRAFTYRTHDDKESFQSDASGDQDIREIGGDFAQVRRTGTQADGRTDNKGLIMVLDNDQGGDDTRVQQRAVANLRTRLLRSELVRLEALLEANDTEASKNWGASATTADPDGELLEQIDLSGDARGIDANVVLFGGSAWVKRMLATRRSDKAGGFASASLTPEQLAGLVGVDKVLRSKFRYQASATAKAKVVADKVYVYYAGQGLMNDDPSNVKRFVTMTPGGQFRVYIEPKLKKTVVAVEHYSRIICTSTLGIRKIAVTWT